MSPRKKRMIKALIEARNKNIDICDVILCSDMNNLVFVPEGRNNMGIDRTRGTLFIPTYAAEMEVDIQEMQLVYVKCAC